jgi:hypothetical protein
VFSADGSVAITTVFRVSAISQGSGPDFRFVELAHLTRTANGDVVVNTDHVLMDGCS